MDGRTRWENVELIFIYQIFLVIQINGVIANADPFDIGDFLFNPVVLLVAAGRAVAQVKHNNIFSFNSYCQISISLMFRLFTFSLLLVHWSTLPSIFGQISDLQRKRQKVSTLYIIEIKFRVLSNKSSEEFEL